MEVRHSAVVAELVQDDREELHGVIWPCSRGTLGFGISIRPESQDFSYLWCRCCSSLTLKENDHELHLQHNWKREVLGTERSLQWGVVLNEGHTELGFPNLLKPIVCSRGKTCSFPKLLYKFNCSLAIGIILRFNMAEKDIMLYIVGPVRDQ